MTSDTDRCNGASHRSRDFLRRHLPPKIIERHEEPRRSKSLDDGSSCIRISHRLLKPSIGRKFTRPSDQRISALAAQIRGSPPRIRKAASGGIMVRRLGLVKSLA